MDLPVVELRRYTLVPGRRDEMIAIFERELMESQEATGMSLLGTFRDLDQPDHFVWVRGFLDMASRHRSLTDFYSGPVWKEHGPSVRPTMIDTDDVLLLRPLGPGTGVGPAPLPEVAEPGGLVVVRIYPAELADRAPRGELASFLTEPAENTFAALPVRADASVYVTFDRSADRRPYDERAEIARLTPTARSPLRWSASVCVRSRCDRRHDERVIGFPRPADALWSPRSSSCSANLVCVTMACR